MAKKTIDFNLKASTEVENLMQNFVPRFGNQSDIDIVETHASLKKELTFKKEDAYKRAELRACIATKKNREEKIKKYEQALLFMLQNRK